MTQGTYKFINSTKCWNKSWIILKARKNSWKFCGLRINSGPIISELSFVQRSLNEKPPETTGYPNRRYVISREEAFPLKVPFRLKSYILSNQVKGEFLFFLLLTFSMLVIFSIYQKRWFTFVGRKRETLAVYIHLLQKCAVFEKYFPRR